MFCRSATHVTASLARTLPAGDKVHFKWKSLIPKERSSIRFIRMFAALAVCGFSFLAAADPPDLTTGKMPDLTKGKFNRTINLGPTGMRGWMFHEGKADTSKSRQILVLEIDKDSPADGIVEPNDIILGASGDGSRPELFTADARRSLAAAIADAESRDTAKLRLLAWRDGKTGVAEITLRTMGAYSDTAPYDCPKSAKILDEGLTDLFENVESGRYTFGALPLIASGNPKYLERLQKEAHALIPSEEKRQHMLSDEPIDQSGKPGWKLGHELIFLAEYYLATLDMEVLPTVEAYAVQIAKNHSMFGTLGHRMGDKNPDGSNNGPMGGHYGAVNSAAMPCFLGLVLASECGLGHPEIAAGIERSNAFYGFYSGRGTIPYGEHPPDAGHGGNGKTGAAALCFSLQPGHAEKAKFFAMMSVASAGEREHGHTGPYFSYLWNPLGANAGGPLAMAEHFRRISWHLDLARRWDGSFVFNNLYGEGPHSGSSYHNFPMSTAALLTYAVPKRTLYITGRDSNRESWLDAEEVAAAGAADDFRPQEREFDTLVKDLANWSPKVRSLAAKSIGKLELRPSEIRTLQEIAKNSNSSAGTRAAACQALGMLSHGKSAELLAELLTDSDSMVRYAAADALRYLPNEARRSVLDEILLATASTAKPLMPIDPDDPLHFAHGRLATLLFYSGNAYGPKGILYNNLDGVDRELLYPAIRAVAATPIGFSRSSLQKSYLNLNKEDVLELADAILNSVRLRAPSDRMFGSGVRVGGLEILARHRIAEAIPAGVMFAMDDGKGIRPLLKVLQEFGGEVMTVDHQPDVIRYLEMEGINSVEGVAETLAAIREGADSEPLLHLKRIDSVRAASPALSRNKYTTRLQVEAHSYLKGESTFTWRKLEGPGEVSFSENGTAAAVQTTATFEAAPGNYILEVSMTDEYGLSSVSETTRVQVRGR